MVFHKVKDVVGLNLLRMFTRIQIDLRYHILNTSADGYPYNFLNNLSTFVFFH